MLDPTKVTILMPGINSRGELADWGIPAAILTEFLDARLVEIARTGDYTALILFSVGTSKGKWGSLLETLFEFKRLYDNEGTLYEALPDLVAEHPQRYRDMTLKELSDEMHAAMGQLDLTNLLHQACDVDPDPVLTPAQTYQKLIRNGTEKVRISEMAGRVAGVMLVPYPPGSRSVCPASGWETPTAQSFVFCWHWKSLASNFLGLSARSTGLRSAPTANTGCGASSNPRSEAEREEGSLSSTEYQTQEEKISSSSPERDDVNSRLEYRA